MLWTKDSSLIHPEECNSKKYGEIEGEGRQGHSRKFAVFIISTEFAK